MIAPIPTVAARRFILGKQGLWPGRRWAGKAGAAEAMRAGAVVQVDPLCATARNHDLTLHSRVIDYEPAHLDALCYQDRAFFDYGACLFIYPMEQLPYWRSTMRRRGEAGRWAAYASTFTPVLEEVLKAVRERGSLANRDFKDRAASTYTYRGGKDTGPALFFLWLTGELMTHGRRGNFERLYGLRQQIAPSCYDWEAGDDESDDYFLPRKLGQLGMADLRNWRWVPGTEGTASSALLPRKQRVIRQQKRMIEDGTVEEVRVEGWKDPNYLFAEDVALLEEILAGRVPAAWRPVETTTEEEVTFLAPLDYVSARGRAKKVFGFEYLWEVYKPEHQRRWGYYTLPILYGDRLVARFDPKLDRATRTLRINGFWVEDDALLTDTAFLDALHRGLARFLRFLGADTADAAPLADSRLRAVLEGVE